MGWQRVVVTSGLALAGLVGLYRARIRPWMYRWGASPKEVEMTLRGDGLVSPGAARTTRAITINAPVEQVWPWVAGLGADPQHRRLRVGDTVRPAPHFGEIASQKVAAVDEDSYLVLVSPSDFEHIEGGEPAAGRWEFYLRHDRSHTRLIVRRGGDRMGHFVFDIAQFITAQRMMRGMKAGAERGRDLAEAATG